MRAGDIVGLGAQAPGDDYAAVLAQRLSDGVERFGLGAVQKPAGVDDHGIRAVIVGADRIALGPQAGQDAFAVDQRLGAAQGHHADGRLSLATVIGNAGTGKVGADVGRILLHRPQICDSRARGKTVPPSGRAQRRPMKRRTILKMANSLSSRNMGASPIRVRIANAATPQPVQPAARFSSSPRGPSLERDFTPGPKKDQMSP